MTVREKAHELANEMANSGNHNFSQTYSINGTDEDLVIKVYRVKRLTVTRLDEQLDKTAHSLMGYGGSIPCSACGGTGVKG